MNEIIKFENEEFGNVRTVIIDNEPWFIASDICKALEIGNTSQALSRLDDDEKDIILNDTPGGKQQMSIINEYGLYSLTISSRKPEAKKFKRWITHEVIPSIRKTGYYSVQTNHEDISGLIQITHKLIEQNEKLISIITNNDIADNNSVNDKLLFYKDIISRVKYPVPIGVIANDYGLSARKLNLMLSNEGVQSKNKGYWNLNPEYLDKNYMVTLTYINKKGAINVNTKWTKEGRLFIYDFLKNHGISPICER